MWALVGEAGEKADLTNIGTLYAFALSAPNPEIRLAVCCGLGCAVCCAVLGCAVCCAGLWLTICTTPRTRVRVKVRVMARVRVRE